MKESGLMFMRNMSYLKKNAGRFIAAVLSVVTVAAFMPVHYINAYAGNTADNAQSSAAPKLQTEVNASVSESVQRALDAGLKNNAKNDGVIRAVLDNIEELPQYGKANFTSLTRGTAERPFVILEIVPYEEYAEFGYFTGGCEPVKVEDMFGSGYYSSMEAFGSADTTQQKVAYFFTDEKEGTATYYKRSSWSDDNLVPVGTELNGYYEFVGDNNGCFVIETDETTNTLSMKEVAQNNGCYIWHTINEFEKDKYSTVYNDTFSDPVYEIGARIYTTRVSTPVKGYYEYVGNGKGNYEIVNVDIDGEKKLIMKKTNADGGSFVWHTISKQEEADYSTDYNDTLSQARDYYKEGDRIYATRNDISNVTDTDEGYWTYVNRELFLTDTLLMSEEEASKYSCVIKTITPDELNSNVDDAHKNGEKSWIDYADLIYIYPKTHDKVIRRYWDYANGTVFNRLGHYCDTSGNVYDNNGNIIETRGKDFSYISNEFEYNDISGYVALDIFEKVSAATNYAAIVLDDNIYNQGDGYFENVSKNVNSFRYKIYNWDLKDTGETYEMSSGAANSSNMYKLSMLLLTVKANLIKQIYLEEGNEKLVVQTDKKTGKSTLVNLLQEGDAAVYWGPMSLMLIDQTYLDNYIVNNNQVKGYAGHGLYLYANDIDNWSRLGYCPHPSSYKYFVNDHIFTFKGDKSMTQDFVAGDLPSDTEMIGGTYKYKDFRNYLEENKDKIGYELDKANPSDAIRYILGVIENKYFGEEMTLKVLDIEPGVGLYVDGNATLPDWKVTANYLRTILPDYAGKIEVVHQTTAEFIGKTEDINSEYDFVYIGLDIGAYNTKKQYISSLNKTVSITDFNDDSLDGKIYFHLGDKMISTCYTGGNRNRSVRFIYNNSGTGVVGSEELRFAGNDITNIKKNELISFIASGKPIVAEKYLYDLESFFIDTGSNIYSLVRDYKNTDTDVNGIYLYSDTKRLQDSLRNKSEGVTFISVPALYNGTTVSESNPTISNPNYLPTNGSGNAYMEYHFNVPHFDVPEEGYNYRIYVDQDRDSKFTANEIVKEGKAVSGDNVCTYEVASSIVGIVQWKIEVYKLDNSNVRYTQTGSSAVRLRSDTEKKKLKVLQIMPKNDASLLNLENDELFKKRYSNLNDFDVSVRTITWNDFEKFFKGEGFIFDMSKDISSTNPAADVLASVSDGLDKSGDKIKSELDGGEIGKLSSYNMIIVGFGDTYGRVDLSNDNGAVEYLQYYTKLGKSILYTHDITSIYNLKYKGNKTFGYTANAMLRDIMGMNRYKAVSTELSDAMKNALIEYQASISYDEISSDQKQGFTYYAMKKLGWTKDQTDWNNPNKTNWNYNKLPYRYMITNPQGNAVVSENSVSSTTGFANTNDLTTTATKVNEGQITTYPYKISDVLPIAKTHAQWYQLNMEDTEVTVWYCLSDPVASGNSGTGSARTSSTAGGGDGSALAYGVSPNDAANNYYIYSKGNVFYSGVGHSAVNSDMEAKLFVNTMIAAYRISYDAPTVRIEKADMTAGTGPGQSSAYGLSVDKNSDTDYSADVPDEYADYVRVYFRPEDMSFSNDMDVRISYAKKDGSMGYITEIWTGEAQGAEAAGTVHTADDTDKFFAGLNNNGLYYFYYRKSDIRTVSSTFTFEVNNNRSAEVGLAYMKLNLQSLYYLD